MRELTDEEHFAQISAAFNGPSLPDEAAAHIATLEAQLAAADRMADFGQAVVDRWDSRDWRSGHTLDFITAQRAALAAYRAVRGGA